MRNGYEAGYDGRQINQAAVCKRDPLPDTFAENALGYLAEAVVLSVYFPEDETVTLAQSSARLTCDVRTLGLCPRNYYRVPVLQTTQGLFDEDLYVPRATSQNISGGALQMTGSGGTPAEDCDGDRVLLAFLNNDFHLPVILPVQFAHPSARNKPAKADGHKRRIRINGAFIEWDKQGNITIDAQGAALEELGASGTEQSAAGTGGEITLITKDGSGATLSVKLDKTGKITIDATAVELTGGSEAMVLGDTLKSALDTFCTTVSTASSAPDIATKIAPAATALQAAIAGMLSTKAKVG